MTMYKAVGWYSQNEYMAGNNLADVMRTKGVPSTQTYFQDFVHATYLLRTVKNYQCSE